MSTLTRGAWLVALYGWLTLGIGAAATSGQNNAEDRGAYVATIAIAKE